MSLVVTDQSNATADGDIVARDKLTINLPAPQPGVVGQLLTKLQSEREKSQHIQHTIDSLARYMTPRATDGVIGLEAKLTAGNREDEIIDAFEMKELFAKLLDQWSLYGSAQEIFAHLLARTEHEFRFFITPQVSQLSRIEINHLISTKVLAPTVDDCGASVFTIDHSVAMGMVYWLAEKCYVRWHA